MLLEHSTSDHLLDGANCTLVPEAGSSWSVRWTQDRTLGTSRIGIGSLMERTKQAGAK